jgi:hypothetical protein
MEQVPGAALCSFYLARPHGRPARARRADFAITREQATRRVAQVSCRAGVGAHVIPLHERVTIK